MKKISKIFVNFIYKFIVCSKKHIYFESASNFFDNSYVLFLYIKNNYPSYKLHYAVRSHEQYLMAIKKQIASKYLLIEYYDNSKTKLRNKLLLFKKNIVLKKCGLAFCSYLVDDFKQFDNVKDNRKIVMLWHSTLAIKSNEDTFKYHFPKSNNYYFVSPTPISSKLRFEESQNFKYVNPVISGKPRNDLILQESNAYKMLFGDSNKNIYLVCTTFRKYSANKEDYNYRDFFNDEFPIYLSSNDLSRLDNYLDKSNSLLVFKIHHALSWMNFEKYNKYKNILFITEEILEQSDIVFYQILKQSKALITDYSSIYFDYLLTGNSIAFIQNDKKEFLNMRGLASKKVQNLLVGYYINSVEDLINFVDNTNNGINIYGKKQKEISIKINGIYNNNCESICKYFSIHN